MRHFKTTALKCLLVETGQNKFCFYISIIARNQIHNHVFILLKSSFLTSTQLSLYVHEEIQFYFADQQRSFS